MSALIGHGSVTSLPLQKIMTDHWTNQATGGHGSSQESSFPINAARTESKAMALIFEMIILLHLCEWRLCLLTFQSLLNICPLDTTHFQLQGVPESRPTIV